MERDSEPVEHTISEDRTRGSKFDTTSSEWAAVKPPSKSAPVPPPAPAHLMLLEQQRLRAEKDASLPALPLMPVGSDVIIGSQGKQAQSWALEQQNKQRVQLQHMQQMLLEQQNQARLMAARAQQDASVPAPPMKSVGNHALQDYEEQMRLLEQQNKARLMSARAEQDAPQVSTFTTAKPQIPTHCYGGAPLGLYNEQWYRVADYLGIPEPSSFSPNAMQSYISDLKSRTTASEPPKAPRSLTIHRVFNSTRETVPRIYLDPPQWIESGAGSHKVLMGASSISNVQAYITKHPEVCFIICRYYAASPHTAGDSQDTDGNGNIKVKHDSESIIPVEKHLALAMKKFAAFSAGNDSPDTSIDLQNGDEFREFSNNWLEKGNVTKFSSPYLPFYHARGGSMDAFMGTLSAHELSQFQRMTDYILKEYEAEYTAVDDLVARSKITHAYLQYLYRPGIVLVQGRGAEARGYLCTSWLEPSTELPPPAHNINQMVTKHALWTGKMPPTTQPASDFVKSYQIAVWHWKFEGLFSRTYAQLSIVNISITDQSPKNINDLDIRPLKHVDPETMNRLRTRGEWVWKCRQQRMIAYEDAGEKPCHTAGERYMIDMKTYRKLHYIGSGEPSDEKSKVTANQLKPELLDSDDPPDDNFVYTGPLSMTGFNLKTKKWVDLDIDRFSEVQWNTGAFESLVLDEKTKRLIQALISNQIEAEMSTDIISGKGNGIIMLLHGGPGTGKTLTAESVAEIARKPLYPVTCGDIGTEPRAVETYLESVLHLGKTWGCVVLLDEADVFLEQRSLEDLKRNALVSVFLRVLEYYDGILILTSNRVGTFDVAFKSRIQLAIHYTSLTTHQRTKIWGNFFRRLKTLNEEGIDFPDLEAHIEDLARHNMNGREIRNAITTARQFARWERKQQEEATFLLNYKVMEEIIETSGKFDSYIEKLNGGMSQDQLAEDEGLRLAKEASGISNVDEVSIRGSVGYSLIGRSESDSL